MKSLYIFIITLTLCWLIACGSSDDELTTVPLFNDVELIETDEDGSNFEFSLPGDVAYAVLGVFNGAITTHGNTIDESNFVCGSRTGLTGWTRNYVPKSQIWDYDPYANDFNDTLVTPASGYYWAVWGYDKWGNLTHSSSGKDTVD